MIRESPGWISEEKTARGGEATGVHWQVYRFVTIVSLAMNYGI
jgi:hypothetical protein